MASAMFFVFILPENLLKFMFIWEMDYWGN
jgi:hypothetical protein